MVAPKISEGDFIRLFTEVGPNKLAVKIGAPLASVMRRRRNIEAKNGIVLVAPNTNALSRTFQAQEFSDRLHAAINDGVMVAASDLHKWPGPMSVALRGFIKLIKELQPKVICLCGDVIDGGRVSRHPPPGWSHVPTLADEIEAAQKDINEIELAAPRNSTLFWEIGNHDYRFSTRLATHAPEYAGIHGTRLADHFGNRWNYCWSTWINDGETVVKHRTLNGGIHAAYQETVKGGLTTVTGHRHSLQVRPFTDYRGTRWGVNLGCLSDPWGPQFGYLEDSNRDWRAGGGVFTYHKGKLLWPETFHAVGPNEIEFRGQVIGV